MNTMGDLFNLEQKPAPAGPVECLGTTFPNDEERREHFLGLLRDRLKDPEFRKIEGFPIGSDEDILALSDPPYYTACPNPFIADFIKQYGKPYDPSKPYSREPFAADVSEGKNDPIYNAHSYHTKVPHKAIMRYNLHYTEPGDIVFDGFCGTRMTGVAAQMCGDKAVVESLGYRVDKEAGNVRDEFPCPHCGAILTKRRMERAWVSKYDSAIKQTIRQTKQVPVLINYIVGGRRAEKAPDKGDMALIAKIESSEIPHWFPTDRMMKGKETRRNDPIGITHVHHFYSKRNLWVLATLWKMLPQDDLLWKTAFTGITQGVSRQQRFRPNTTFPNMIMSGTLYVGSLIREWNVYDWFNGKLGGLRKGRLRFQGDLKTVISMCARSDYIPSSSDSMDYVFVDPPFGANLNYSELNFNWESWLKVWTNNKSEAIENNIQDKGINEYRQLMLLCFKEAYRVLKPGRWMTIEFSNTKASVWNSIQTALMEAGFIVANVSALDKKQMSFKAITTPTAAKQDLVISAYKPNGGFEERFQNEAQTEEGVWDFVRTHLKYLPVIKHGATTKQLIAVAERDPRILFDQMIAFYVRKGYTVPISSQEFQVGLAQRFIERDGMYFLPEQAAEYDRKKMTSGEPVQASLFVSDESSAIAWLRQLLKDKPQTTQDIHPLFIKKLGGWQKHDKPRELSELLEQNFLRYDGKGEVPSQIHSYLSTNFKELRNLPKDAPELRTKGKDRWYVPDPNKTGDMEKKREKALLKEFEEYRTSSQKRLKVFRLEAVRAGFKKAWQERDYATIITVARKVPENILQEDPKLLMWYDQALTRSGEDLSTKDTKMHEEEKNENLVFLRALRGSSSSWMYSLDHQQLCQVIEAQTLWGETTCRVWLPGRDSVVRIPASRLKPLESAVAGPRPR